MNTQEQLLPATAAPPRVIPSVGWPKLGRALLVIFAAAAWWLVYRNLESFAKWFTYQLLGMHLGSHLASAVEFLVFEAPKVLMLLTIVVFGVGIVRSFFTPERTRRILAGKRESAGWVIGRLKLERWVEAWVYKTVTGSGQNGDDAPLTWNDRVQLGREAVKDIVGKVWPYVIAGIALGAGIHGYVPQDFMASIMGKSAWWSVPLAVVIGIPMYSNAAGIIPIVQALLGKGAALGTVLAFMMAVIGLSLPEMVILRKVLRIPLIVTFASVVGLGILLVGYLFNIVM